MLSYIAISLFTGFLAAIASLVAQVFFGILNDLFLSGNLQLQYTSNTPINLVIIAIIISATLEEITKYATLRYSLNSFTNSIKDVLLFGTLFGIGFFGFEIFLRSLWTPITSIPITILSIVALTHIITSTLLLLLLQKRFSYTKTFLLICIIILIHSCVNIVLFQNQ